MSNRTIKKLLKNGIVSPVPFVEEEESDHSPGEEISSNKFSALLDDLPSDSELNGSIENENGFPDDEIVVQTNSKQNSKRKKKKKNIKLKNSNGKEDEIDRCVREVNELLGEASMDNDSKNLAQSKDKEQESLLSVSYKYLDPLIEMKRIFGARVVENDRAQQRHDRHGQTSRTKRSVIIGGPAPYPEGKTASISMEIEPEEQDGCVYYRFVHLPTYQKTQFEFSKIVNTIEPDRLLLFLHENPLHVDCILTASEIHRMGDDPSTAAKLLERALYVMEDSLHPLFNYSTGKCRMHYRQQENRAFFIALFRHILNMERKGCTRTALELCKLLLNLSPNSDPLGASLMLDYFAIRAKEYAWLVSLYDFYEEAKNLSLLPNFSFSVPLALYHLSGQKLRSPNKEASQYKILSVSPEALRERADHMLQNALIMFPSVLTVLLDKCSVKADQAVVDHPYFGPQSQFSMTKGLKSVVQLFIGRNYYLWKEQDVMLWLEENVKKTIERIDNDDPLIAECLEKRKSRYLGTPNPIYRHILIAEIKDVTISLPDSLARIPLHCHDPLPPPDNVRAYKFPQETRSRDAETVVSSFFRSLMPTYDANEPQHLSDEEGEPADVDRGEQLREGVQTILDSLRNLAASIRGENPEGEPPQQDQPQD